VLIQDPPYFVHMGSRARAGDLSCCNEERAHRERATSVDGGGNPADVPDERALKHCSNVRTVHHEGKQNVISAPHQCERTRSASRRA
jgi:hypothetical protein